MKDLENGKVHEDYILWVKTIEDPALIVSIHLIVEDKNGDALFLSLFN